MGRPFTSSIYKDFGGSSTDILEFERRLLRVTTKTYGSTGTYLFLKTVLQITDGDFYVNQGVTVTVLGNQELINNLEDISNGTQPGKREKLLLLR